MADRATKGQGVNSMHQSTFDTTRAAAPFGLFACLLIFLSSDGAAQDADPAPKFAQEFRQSFKGINEKPPEWELYGVSPEKLVKFEPEGLRITIPTGFNGPKSEFAGNRPRAGVSLGMVAKGDFEITTRFEILELGKQPKKAPGTTRIALEAVLSGAIQNAVEIVRRRDASGDEFHAWMRIGPNGPTKKQFPTQAKRGQIRLVRTGQTISYHAEEDDGPFRQLWSLPCVGEDVIDVRMTATTADETASFDVRLSDFSVRAASIEAVRTLPAVRREATPSKRAVAAPDPLAAAPPEARSRLWVIGAAVVLLLALGLGMWFVVRRSRPAATTKATPAAPTAFISFPCVCGKLLKAKLQAMGADVKCPECGRAVTVPK
jgi:hypothetical protein